MEKVNKAAIYACFNKTKIKKIKRCYSNKNNRFSNVISNLNQTQGVSFFYIKIQKHSLIDKVLEKCLALIRVRRKYFCFLFCFKGWC